MPDITTINASVRKWLDENNWKQVDLEIPMWDGQFWYVLVKNGEIALGTVICDEAGKIKERLSFPNRS